MKSLVTQIYADLGDELVCTKANFSEIVALRRFTRIRLISANQLVISVNQLIHKTNAKQSNKLFQRILQRDEKSSLAY